MLFLNHIKEEQSMSEQSHEIPKPNPDPASEHSFNLNDNPLIFSKSLELLKLRTQKAIREIEIIDEYARLQVNTTLQTARQIFEIQTEGNNNNETIWHSYAQAYTLRVNHAFKIFAEQLTQTLTQDLESELIQRGLYEIKSIVKAIKESLR
jgi:hypothetical protein